MIQFIGQQWPALTELAERQKEQNFPKLHVMTLYVRNDCSEFSQCSYFFILYVTTPETERDTFRTFHAVLRTLTRNNKAQSACTKQQSGWARRIVQCVIQQSLCKFNP
jgi:hypothetical protein